jgi:hypothetical protein
MRDFLNEYIVLIYCFIVGLVLWPLCKAFFFIGSEIFDVAILDPLRAFIRKQYMSEGFDLHRTTDERTGVTTVRTGTLLQWAQFVNSRLADDDLRFKSLDKRLSALEKII